LSDLFEDIEFSTSLFGVSSVVSIVEFAFLGLSGKSIRSILEFLLVLTKSSLLVDKSGFNFSELIFVSSKLFFGFFSEIGNGNHQIIEVDCSLDFSLNIIIEESGEINLELFEETNTFAQSSTVKRRSDFNEGLDWVG